MSKSKTIQYTAAILAAATTVAYVAEVPVYAQTNPFVDVKQESTHYNAIVSLAEAGIVTGVTANSYKPNANATRGEAALFIANALQLNLNNVVDPNFSDVPVGSKYYKAIAILTELGVVSGYSDGKFKPGNTLTRAQIAKMLTLAFSLQLASSSTTKFTDVNKIKDANTKKYIQTLVNNGVTTGTTATTYSPNNNLTRAQLATFLYRALQLSSSDLEIIGIE